MAKLHTMYAAIVMLLVGVKIQCANSTNATLFSPLINNSTSPNANLILQNDTQSGTDANLVKDGSPTVVTLIPISSTVQPNVVNETTTIADNTTTTEKTTTTTKNPQMLLIPPAEVNASIAQMHNAPRKKGQIIISSEPDCPSLHDADSLSQTQLIKRLTHGCRYDRLERPITFGVNGTRQPINIWTRAYVYFMQNLEAHDLQFKLHTLLQFRYVDPRLVFKEVAPKRKEPIMGEQSLRDALWVPHIFLANERSSSILGTAEKDVLTSISPDGTVIISTRIQASLHCWMNLQKFPFDEQTCHTIFESWMYNTSELVLHWETKSPVTFAPELHLTEYALLNTWTNETTVNADLSDLRHGAFAGNYSSLSFSLHLSRQMGFYLMDYFLPSMMIVAISWVSFWLQADQSAPRIMLGTSTMLTFITLASAQGKTLPKVSYIKVSEVWFLGCTGFIFGSLVEFAFVNTIWRRKKNVELKKVNSKYILKSTLTPRPSRKDMSPGLQKSRSCSSLDGSQNGQNSFNNYLTVHSFPSKTNIPTITTTKSLDDLITENGSVAVNMEPSSSSATLHVHGQEECYTPEPNGKSGWTTMTPQEIAYWIDRRSRFLFPGAFVAFNALFWTFVYCM
ncbi:pH-sensitive chloride channel 2-like isoform X2 [Bradysia coprophila]|uniref:pH-sensitive chloride channel 2-like isoform X1 n=1 Tax=Bradysia coprophila TaxID=38358 RepID=UPI00187DBDB5|nr:pH-sensitive chloride channel 2-like isoform X1 [Bradysia coprophila]XP_037048240.1 pH-sensitive chloride channel 2-like isoform X1 [Bradysia coprophila]XP_037048241.1 pH-sensitive chloride channel 2-like isoform X2 [Bradysia coprophila]